MLRTIWCRKALASKSKHHSAPVLPDVQTAQHLHRARGLAGRGAEGREIMLTEQQCCGGAHRLAVQRTETPADEAGLQRRPRL
jgi:hypothetical protein